MYAGRDRGEAAARGEVKAVIVAVEATVNEVGNNVKKTMYKINKTIQKSLWHPLPPPGLKNKLLLLLISWQLI